MGKKSPKNRLIVTAGEWKQTELPGSCMADDEFQYLACIEELAPAEAAELISEKSGTTKPAKKEKKKKAKKRAAEPEPEEDSHDDEGDEPVEEEEPQAVPAVKTKKAKKRKSDSLPSHASIDDGSHDGLLLIDLFLLID